MDPNRLTTGEKLLGASALVLFISSFIKLWGSIEVTTDFPEGTPQEVIDTVDQSADLGSFNLWSGYDLLPKLGILIALILVIVVVAKAASALDNANLPLPLGLIYLGGSAIVVITMLIALLAGAEGENETTVGIPGLGGSTIEVQRGLLLYLGILLALATAVGAFLHMQQEGTTPRPAAGPGAGSPPPQPPGT